MCWHVMTDILPSQILNLRYYHHSQLFFIFTCVTIRFSIYYSVRFFEEWAPDKSLDEISKSYT